ncbi:MAG: preprotein translocase subunit SecG [Clostridia bacterium]|nr:preprotein translocase subunit SecG [Clostridia bacterium]NLF19779.1 preprotein translocase subunit SecG [Clostridiaceae bacterium]
METVLIVLAVLDVLVCIGLAMLVLFQNANDRGLGTMGGSSNDSFYSSNMGRTKDVLMRRLTIILGAAFVVLTVLINALLG